MIHAACAKGGKVLLKWIWEGQCFYPSWRLEQNPDAHQWRKKSRRGCKETGIWCKRKSGGCQWDHPLWAWFLVVDLAVTSSHTKKPTFALQTQYLWKLGWRTAAAASPWKEQHSPWESARLLHFGDVCKILPSQPIYCAFLLGDSNSCTAHISTAFSWSLSIWFWPHLRVRMHFLLCQNQQGFVGGCFPLDRNHFSAEVSLSPNKNLSITC